METNNWLNEIMNSTNGITKVSPDDSLFLKIQTKINQEQIPNQWLWFAAASFVILLSLNIKIVFSDNKKDNNSIEVLAASVENNNQLY